MTKADLSIEVANAINLSIKDSREIVEIVFDSMVKALQGADKVEIREFASFRTRVRRGRSGRNPKSGKKVEVPPKRIVYFKTSKELRRRINS